MSEYKNKTKNKKTSGNELENVSSDVVDQINTVYSVLYGKISKLEILHALKETDYNVEMVIEKYLEGDNDWTVVEKVTKKVTKPTNEFKTKNQKKKTGEFKKEHQQHNKTSSQTSEHKNTKTKKEFKNSDEQSSTVPSSSSLKKKEDSTEQHQEDEKKVAVNSTTKVPAKVKTFVQTQPVEVSQTTTMSYSQIVTSDQQKNKEVEEEIQTTKPQEKPKKKKTSKKTSKNKIEQTTQQEEQEEVETQQPQQQQQKHQQQTKQIFEPLEDLNSTTFGSSNVDDEDSVILDVSSNGFDYSDINLQFGTLGVSQKNEEKVNNNSSNQQTYQNPTWNQNQTFMQEQQPTV